MDTSFKPTKKLLLIFAAMILIGLVAVIAGFASDPARTWPNVLLNNMYFITLSIGALMFFGVQYISGSSWSALIQRIPLAAGAFLPIGLILMLLIYFGLHDIYEWSHPGITETDKLIAHKAPFLNVPFFMIRIVIYFALWVPLFFLLRRMAKKEDLEGGEQWYHKSTFYSKVFIFSAVLIFSLAAVDWVMTIDPHWYSTIFGFRAMITSIYYGTAIIILLIFLLKGMGFFPQINEAHRHDLARYLFRFSIVFGYLWFMQFLILWYANIPESTIYYTPRFLGEWKFFFYAEPIINWAIPFVVVMSDDIGKKKPVLIGISALLMIGLWMSLFLQIMPGSYGVLKFGFIEVGMWIGYAGLYLVMVFLCLSGLSIVPLNHPMLDESIHHHL
ncbi:MAG: hypothetical protein V2I46_05075 [Bacteroides sp.]|jgi:hypothetical protein|nr:hypothetical protein [Bacteroides sp.]